jgi:threonine dehydrogenase-like Zn-dependent dehydrogenase
MKAVCWFGKQDMRVEEVPDPSIMNSRDVILKVTSTAICGSDLHLYNNYIPTLQKGDILGHEFMGEVVEVGPGVRNLKVGDRVVTAFPIACGMCNPCKAEMYSLCENTNPNAGVAEKFMGHSPCGIFGYSHMLGGYAGGQAQFVRVPFADVGCIKIPEAISDEKVLFLSDIFPTGYMGAEMCGIKPGDTIAVWGCGPVGQFAIASAFMLGAERVTAIDRFEYRLAIARDKLNAEVINYEEQNVYEALMEMTGGLGPDHCIDAVGLEAHKPSILFAVDKIMQETKMENDRPLALREAIMCCKNGGTVSVIGVYSGLIDKFPMGSVMNRSLTIRTGQCHVQRYMKPLLDRIERGEIDPSFVITHELPLSEAPHGYRIFNNKLENCEKIVLKPAA